MGRVSDGRAAGRMTLRQAVRLCATVVCNRHTPAMDAQHSCESGFYVDLQKTGDGDLRIRLTPNGRRHFTDIREQRDAFGINAALCALLDDHLQTGWEMVPPEDIGALTAAPILSDEIVRTTTRGGFWRPVACTGIRTIR